MTTGNNITKSSAAVAVKHKWHELHAGPSDWIDESDVFLKNVLLLDYAATSLVLDCLPEKSEANRLALTNSSALNAIFSRADRGGPPLRGARAVQERCMSKTCNTRSAPDVYREWAPSLVKVWESVSKPFWPTPYVDWMVDEACPLARFRSNTAPETACGRPQ